MARCARPPRPRTADQPSPRSPRLAPARGIRLHCALHQLEGRGPVEPFEFGDQLPGGITVYEIDAICPDETALYIRSHHALACADGIIRPGADAPLAFVPDSLMDEPERTKQGLREAYRGLLELDLDLDLLLLAHGDPIVGGAKRALRTFVERGA